jgi:tetratricopeptide (TPR) repeat protein
LIFEHRNYIPSLFFFVPVAIFILGVIDYFSYKRVIQFTMVAAITFLLFAQGHTVFTRNALFAQPLLIWTDNVEKTPSLSLPLNNLGTAYWKQGLFDKAFEPYTRAVELNRYTNFFFRGVGLHNLGMYHLRVTGDYDKAIALFQSVVDAYPDFWPSYQYAAECLILKGDLSEAANILREAVSSWPSNADLHLTLGILMLRLEKIDKAANEARHSMSLNPSLSDPLRVLGEAFRRKGNDKAALFYWRRWLEKNPNDLEGNLALIELYAKQKNDHDLSKTIGKLVYLKGSEGWRELINRFVKEKRFLVYTPDPEVIIALIKANLNDQLGR